MVQVAPSSLEVLDFQFKLQCRLKIFQNEDNSTFNKTCNVVAAASKYGLLFIGTNSASFQVIQLQTLRKYNVKDGDITNYLRRIVSLPSKPQHLSVNCDSTKLSVVVKEDDCIKAIIYDIPSFLQQNISISSEIRLSPTPGVMAIETVWNPTVPSVYTVCKDDGSLAVYDIKPTGIEINELPKTVGATCICWSPKGKQIAVSSSDGKITQYKPDLKVAKIIDAPPLEGSHLPIALQWISNYQFIAVYKITSPKDQCNLLVINCPKVGGVTYINYYDVCYSYGSARPYQFYMLLQHMWNILLVASSNSMEVGVLGFEKDVWTQWNLADSSRAELPLSSTKQDTFPIGLSLDVSSTEPILCGESTLPPAPLLLLLSDHGVLSCFHVVNLKEGAAQICRPPEVLSNSSTYFTEASPATATTTPLPSKPVPINPVKQNMPPLSLPQPAVTTFSFSFKQSANLTTSIANTFQQPASQPFSLSSTTTPPAKVDKSSNQFGPSIFSTNLKLTAPSTTASETFTISSDKPALGNLSNRAQTPLPPMPEARTTSNNKHAAIARAPPKPELQDVPSTNEDTESLIAQMVKEECVTLESELKMLLSHGQNIKVDLGTDNEATSIVQNTNNLQEFIDEINEICQSQAVEVHHLKQELIQTWAWYEEANSRFNANKDPSLISLMRAQPLDAASARQLEDIRHMLYYLESQLKQANVALDEQWETFQDSCKKKLSLKLPSIETIYQSMVKQSATIQKQFYILKDISNRVKARARSSTVPHLLMSRADGDTLDEQLRNLTIQPKHFVHLQYERVFKRQNQLSTDKATKLRNFLKGRRVAHVSVNKPQLTNSSTRLIGLANAPFSPIVPSKKLQPQRLNFVQSTPKPPDNQLNNAELTKLQSKLEPPINETNEVGNKEIGSAKSNDGETKTFIFGDAKSSSHGSAFVPATQNVYSVKSSLFGDPTGKAEAPPQQKSIFSFNTPMSTVNMTSSTSEPVQKSLFTAKPPNSPVVTTVTSKFSFGSPINNIALSFSFANKIENITTSTSGGTSNVKSAFGSAAPNTSMFSSFKPLDSNSKSIFASPFPALSATVTKPATTAVFAPVVGSVKTSEVMSRTSDASKTSTNLFGAVTTTTTASGNGNVSNLPVQILPTAKAIEISKLATATSAATSAPVLSRIGASVTITPVMAPAKVETPPAESTATSGSSIINKAVIKSVNATTASQIIAPIITIAQSKETATEVSQSFVFSPVSVEAPSNSAATTTTPSVFTMPISTVSTSSSASSVFSAAAAAPFASTQQPFSFFGSTSELATPSTAHTWSIFGSNASATSPFAIASQATAASTVSVAKTPVTVTTQEAASSVFNPTTSNTATPIIQPSLFGTSATVTTSTTTQSSVFGSTNAPATTPVPSIFGGGSGTSTASSSTTQSSLFGSTTVSTTQPSVFGGSTASTTQSSLFGSTTVSTTQPLLFGSTTVSTTQPSLFGSATVSTTQPSLFGSATVSTTQPSLFGTTTASTTQGSIFGGNTSSSQPSMFGSNTASTSQPSIFGGPAVTTGQSSIFGSPTVTATTTQATIFPPGSLTTSPAPVPAFGASPVFGAPTTQQPSVFGGLGTSSPSGGIFGTSTPAATDSVFPAIKSTAVGAFGTPSATFSTATASGPSFFAPSSSTAPSMFGQPPAFGSGSLFSNPPTSNTTGSVFGSSPPSASNAFGATPTTNTAFGSGFGSSTNTNAAPFASTTDSFRFATTTGPTTSGSFGFNKQAFTSFGNNSNTTDANSLSFGNMGLATSSPSNAFGSSAGFAQNPFGRNASHEQQKSPFSGGSIFGASPATTASTSSSIFGGSSPFSKTAPAFGGPATFGTSSAFSQQTPAFGQSAFGNSGNSIFGGTSQPGPFSRGAQPSVNQSGFGAAPVFGTAPAFASTSPGAFGAPPAFGAPSAFGMNSNFNNSSKPPFSDAFGSSNQQNPTFANLANQTTLGFGNLAQQNQSSTSQSTFSGGSSFSNWR